MSKGGFYILGLRLWFRLQKGTSDLCSEIVTLYPLQNWGKKSKMQWKKKKKKKGLVMLQNMDHIVQTGLFPIELQ